MSKVVFPILLIGAAIFMFYLFIDPGYQEVQELKAEQAEYDQALENANALRSKLDSLRGKLNSFPPEQLDRLGKMLPSQVDNVRLVLELDSVASRQDMRLENVTVSEYQAPASQRTSGEQASGPEVRTTEAQFSLVGSYEDLVGFMRDLESSLRIVDVSSVEFRGNARSDEEDVYQHQIILQTYWLNIE